MKPSVPSRTLVHAVIAAVTVVGVTAAGAVYMKARAHSDPGLISATAPRSSPSPTVSVPAQASASAGEEESVEPVTEPALDPDELLSRAMDAVSVPSGAKVAVAVLDLESGQSAAYGRGTFDTASIVKVDILAALLLQAQDAGRPLTVTEKAYATKMIENSDNDAATALWRTIGGAAGLDSANERFGLTDTTGGSGDLWGLTQTTAADQLTLLRQVFGDESKLSESSRAYLRGLMETIAAGQAWGVSAVADGSSWALKNGWLPRSTTGLWDVNSIGRVTVDGGGFLVAVLSKGTATQQRGITLVEATARAAVSALTEGSTSASASVAG
ncbi:serine hydrolase [Streptomyces brasiliensis]|uniref:serine hydrolase n=1 Tax=Streptomyces brasiliensis TaxID=1954 RepID=UPI001670C759|nr:serine hydrolase [Streptomyces brasiliensis]